jgi:hypothetical protein
MSSELLLAPSSSLTLFYPLLGVSEHRDLGETIGGDKVAIITKDNPQTVPTYTDTLHVYSTVEGMSSQLVQGGLCSSPSPTTADPQVKPTEPTLFQGPLQLLGTPPSPSL